MEPLFIVTERFDTSSPGWERYITWSRLHHLVEVVSLDSMLCPPVISEILDADWPHVCNEDFMLRYFHDLDYLLERAGPLSNRNLLCVFLNPEDEPMPPASLRFCFELEGFDLVNIECDTSALTNCGGFRLAFENTELSPHGLLGSLRRANEVRDELRKHYPEEHHAACNTWAIFRAVL